jgi:hypothetical protein
MLSLLILQHLVVPLVLFTEDVETKEETVADIITVRVNGTTRRTYGNLVRTHRKNPKIPEITRYQKTMERAFTRVSRTKTIKVLEHP